MPLIPVIPLMPLIPVLPVIPVMALRSLKGGEGGGEPKLLGGGSTGGGGRRSAQLKIASRGGGFRAFLFLESDPQLVDVLQLRSLPGLDGLSKAAVSGESVLPVSLATSSNSFSPSPFSLSSSVLLAPPTGYFFISISVSFSTASYVGGGSEWNVLVLCKFPAISNDWIFSLGLVFSVSLVSLGV